MPQTIIDLAFGVATMNDPELIQKFGLLKYDSYFQNLFFQRGRDLSESSGDKSVAMWREVALSRKPAPFVGRRQAGVGAEGVDDALKTCVMADVRMESQPIPLDEITSETAAQNILAQERVSNRKRLAISREILASGVLKGSAVINSSTVPGSKVSFTLTFGVTALTPAASWATSTTPIASQELDAFQQTYHDACGLEFKRLIVDGLVKRYVRQNSEVINLVSGVKPDGDQGVRLVTDPNTVLGPGFASFELEGLMWDVHRTKANIAGTLTKYLGDKQLIALPDDSELPMVLAYAQGYGAIPREAIGSENVAGMGFRAPQRGEYSYAYTIPSPAAVVIVDGWRGLFMLTHPEAVGYCDDVTSLS